MMNDDDILTTVTSILAHLGDVELNTMAADIRNDIEHVKDAEAEVALPWYLAVRDVLEGEQRRRLKGAPIDTAAALRQLDAGARAVPDHVRPMLAAFYMDIFAGNRGYAFRSAPAMFAGLLHVILDLATDVVPAA